jgi:hypothetical protein
MRDLLKVMKKTEVDSYKIETLSEEEQLNRLFKAYSQMHYNAFGTFLTYEQFEELNLFDKEVK